MTVKQVINAEYITDPLDGEQIEVVAGCSYTPIENEIIDRLNAQENHLNKYFKERKEIVKSMYASLLAKQHLIMIGPPGIAKSALINGFNSGMADYRLFKRLLTKLTAPEELFGPYSLKALRNDQFTRNYAGKFAECEIAFLDEVFRGNSNILNSLLTAMNEHELEDLSNIPLEIIFGATNSIPEDDASLQAFFDRFLSRHIIKPISDGRNFEAMLKLGKFVMPAGLVVKKDEINLLRAKMEKLDTNEIIHKIKQIWVELKKQNIYPSDRRFKWAISLCQAHALLNKRSKVVSDDLEIITSALWTDPKEIPLVEGIVQKYMNPIMKQVKDMIAQAEEIKESLKNVTVNDKGGVQQITEGLSKLSIIAAQLKDLVLKSDSEVKVKIQDKIGEINAIGKEIQDEKTGFLKKF